MTTWIWIAACSRSDSFRRVWSTAVCRMLKYVKTDVSSCYAVEDWCILLVAHVVSQVSRLRRSLTCVVSMATCRGIDPRSRWVVAEARRPASATWLRSAPLVLASLVRLIDSRSMFRRYLSTFTASPTATGEDAKSIGVDWFERVADVVILISQAAAAAARVDM